VKVGDLAKYMSRTILITGKVPREKAPILTMVMSMNGYMELSVGKQTWECTAKAH